MLNLSVLSFHIHFTGVLTGVAISCSSSPDQIWRVSPKKPVGSELPFSSQKDTREDRKLQKNSLSIISCTELTHKQECAFPKLCTKYFSASINAQEHGQIHKWCQHNPFAKGERKVGKEKTQRLLQRNKIQITYIRWFSSFCTSLKSCCVRSSIFSVKKYFNISKTFMQLCIFVKKAWPQWEVLF